MSWVLLFAGIVTNAAASILMKYSMEGPGREMSLSNPLSILTNWTLIAAVALYGSAFVLYAITLKLLPLHVAHPILTAGAIGVVAVSSVVLFSEKLDVFTIIGLVLIVVGVVFVAARAGAGA